MRGGSQNEAGMLIRAPLGGLRLPPMWCQGS